MKNKKSSQLIAYQKSRFIANHVIAIIRRLNDEKLGEPNLDSIVQVLSEHGACLSESAFRQLFEGIPPSADKATRYNIYVSRLLILIEQQVDVFFVPWDHQAVKKERRFRLIELFSHILPVKARKESFEPAYNDSKADYLHERRRFDTPLSRKWLDFCFVLHVLLMLGQCVWGMCSEKIKRGILRLLPEIFRNFWGS